MANIRTANKRHQRAIIRVIARGKPSGQAPVEKAKPAKAGS